MATWVRSGTGTAPSSTDADLTGRYSLDNGTAPGDFDPAGVTSVQIAYTITGTSFGNDTWDDLRAATLDDGTNTAATINGTDNTGLGNNVSNTSETDSSPNTGLSTANWEAMAVSGATTINGSYTTWSQSKGKDGGVQTMSALTVTITYTPASTDRQAMVSWVELETPNAARQAQVSWVELEVPEYVPPFKYYERTKLGPTTFKPHARLTLPVEFLPEPPPTPWPPPCPVTAGYYLLDGVQDWLQSVDSTRVDQTSDMAVIACIALDDYSTGANQTIASKYQSGGNQRSWRWEITTIGEVAFRWSEDGIGGITETSNETVYASPGITDGDSIWLKASLDVDDGASNYALNLSWSTDPPDTPLEDITWTLFSGSPETGAATTSIFSSSASIKLGVEDVDTNDFAGKIYGFWLISGLGLPFFSDTFTGSNGDPLDVAEWTDDDVGDNATTDIQNNQASLESGTSSSRIARTIALNADHDNVDIRFSHAFSADNGDGHQFRFHWRGADNWTYDHRPSSGYFIQRRADNGSALVVRNDGASGNTTIGTLTASGLGDTTRYQYRIRHDGGTLKVRLWQDGTDEPSSWGVEVTDSNYLSGAIQMMHTNFAGTSTLASRVDDVVVTPIIRAAADFRTAQPIQYIAPLVDGDYAGAVDDPSFDTTNDLDVRALAYVNEVKNDIDLFVARWGGDTTNDDFTFGREDFTGGPNDGTGLMVRWRRSGGGTLDSLFSDGDAIKVGGWRWYRAVVDVSVASATFYISDDPPTTAPASVSWTQHGAVKNLGAVSSRNSTVNQTMRIGGSAHAAGETIDGRIAYAEVRDGIGGTIIVDPDWRAVTEGFMHMDGTGDFISTTSDYSLGTNVVEMFGCFALDDWTPAAKNGLITNTDNLATRGCYFAVDSSPSGFLEWDWFDGTVTQTVNSSVAAGGTDGQHLWVRIVHDLDVGGTDSTVIFYTSTDPITTDPASVNWTQLGTTYNHGSTTSITAAVDQIAAGRGSGGSAYLAGEVYYAQANDNGAAVATFDARTKVPDYTEEGDVAIWSGNAVWQIEDNQGHQFGLAAGDRYYGDWGGLYESWDPIQDAVWVAGTVCPTPPVLVLGETGVPRSVFAPHAHIHMRDFPPATTNRKAQVSWTEFETPDAARQAMVSWAELEIPNAARQAMVSWAELELPNAARQAQVSWTELELEDAARQAQVSWTELELPDGPRQAMVSWVELEIPPQPRQAMVSWVELEIPTAARQAMVSWAELELGEGARQAQVSWVEFEVPGATRKGQVSWVELEIENAARQAMVSWAEFEVPNGPRQAQVSWVEFELPDAARQAQVSWVEFEVPIFNRQAMVSWVELEIPSLAAETDRYHDDRRVGTKGRPAIMSQDYS